MDFTLNKNNKNISNKFNLNQKLTWPSQCLLLDARKTFEHAILTLVIAFKNLKTACLPVELLSGSCPLSRWDRPRWNYKCSLTRTLSCVLCGFLHQGEVFPWCYGLCLSPLYRKKDEYHVKWKCFFVLCWANYCSPIFQKCFIRK